MFASIGQNSRREVEGEAYIGAEGLDGAADQALAAGVLHGGLILLGVWVVLPVLLNCTRAKQSAKPCLLCSEAVKFAR